MHSEPSSKLLQLAFWLLCYPPTNDAATAVLLNHDRCGLLLLLMTSTDDQAAFEGLEALLDRACGRRGRDETLARRWTKMLFDGGCCSLSRPVAWVLLVVGD